MPCNTAKQAEEGHGLESQEYRCREYARQMGYVVEAVFPDDVSGAGDFMKRPGMVALLSFLDAQPGKRFVVIFDDLKRFARDTEFHGALRRAFKQRGAQIECLNFKFDETPEGEFVELVFAAQGQLERKQNQRQVLQKMQARVKRGYWCFSPTVAYEFVYDKTHGKIIVPREPNASIVREALEGFSSGRFQTPTEVRRFLELQPAFPKMRNGRVSLKSCRRPSEKLAFRRLYRRTQMGHLAPAGPARAADHVRDLEAQSGQAQWQGQGTGAP